MLTNIVCRSRLYSPPPFLCTRQQQNSATAWMGGGGDDIGQSLIDGTDVVRAHVLGLNRALQSAGSTLQFDVEALTSKVLASNHPAENPTTILVESTEAAENAATEAVQALCQPRPRPHPPSHSAGLHSSTPVASSP